jgi:hypothetical protein
LTDVTAFAVLGDFSTVFFAGTGNAATGGVLVRAGAFWAGAAAATFFTAIAAFAAAAFFGAGAAFAPAAFLGAGAAFAAEAFFGAGAAFAAAALFGAGSDFATPVAVDVARDVFLADVLRVEPPVAEAPP